MKEGLNSLRHFEKKDFNSLSHIGKQERFNSLSQEERLQLFESSWKDVHKKEVQFDESRHISWKKINSESHTKKVFQFCESYWLKISSVSRIRISKKFHFESRRVIIRVQFFESFFFFLEKIFFFKKKYKSVRHKKVKFFEFFSLTKKKKSLWVMLKKGFNSLSHIEKNLWVILKKSSVLCVFWKNFLSHILWVVFLKKKKKTQKFNSLSDTQKRINSLSHTQEISILWVILLKKTKVQFFESC